MLIDLGEAIPPVDAPAPWRPASLRLPLAALALVLVALLGASAPPAPADPLTIIPAGLGDTYFVEGDRLYVAAGGPPASGHLHDRTITTYGLPDGELLGRTTVAVDGSISEVAAAGDELVVQYQVETSQENVVVALRADSAQELWRRNGFLSGVSAADGLALVDEGTAKAGIDLASGRARWTVRAGAGLYVDQTGWDGSSQWGSGNYPRWLVAITDTGRLTVSDARTGALLASTTLAGLQPWTPDGYSVTGDLVLVDGLGPNLTAYRLPGLTRLWQAEAALPQSWSRNDCGGIICVLTAQRDMTALDSATGRELWKSDRWMWAEPVGGKLLATHDEGDTPQAWLADPRTGRPLGNFGRWSALAYDDGKLYGQLPMRGDDRFVYGLLDPATMRAHFLGTIDRVSGRCDINGGLLICRLVDASIAVRSLR